jgi:S-adenosylmethionine hydrolase
MIVLFTDFGLQGPYTGQMKVVLHQMAPGVPAIDLFADAPVGNPKASAYLLAAYAEWFAGGTVFLSRSIPASAPCNKCAQLGYRLEAAPSLRGRPGGDPPRASMAATVRRDRARESWPRGAQAHRRTDWPDDLCEIVYVDHYGNAMTGLRAVMLQRDARLVAAGQVLPRAGTFSDRPPGMAFWYENSNGLAEIAVNQGRADRELGLAIGSPVEIVA